MKIGLIGHNDSVQRMRAVLERSDSFVEFFEYPYALKSLRKVLARAQEKLDGILFTGVRYYEAAKRYTTEKIPWSYPKTSAEASLGELLKASLNQDDLTCICHDLGNNSRLFELLCQAGLQAEKINLYDYTDSQTYRDFINNVENEGFFREKASKFFLDHLRHGEAKIVLSTSNSTVKLILEEGFPAYLVLPTEDSIIAAFNELRYRSQTRKFLKETVHLEAAVWLKIRFRDSVSENRQIYKQIQVASELETAVFGYADSIGASLEKISDLEYHLYSSRTEIETIYGNQHHFEFLEPILSKQFIEQISLGVGYGKLHSEAADRARRACWAAGGQSSHCYYLEETDGILKGPFLLIRDKSQKDYDWISLQRISQKSGVGMSVLQSISRAKLQYRFDTFTAAELSSMCGLSINNINRILVKLEDAKAVEIVGMRSFASTGRPRRVFRLNFGIPAENVRL